MLIVDAKVAGTVDISEAAEAAVDLARRTQAIIRFDFNGVMCHASPGDDADDVVGGWMVASRPANPPHPLTFADLRLQSLARCAVAFHPLQAWSPTDWGTAVAGEVGEALNLVKKLRRGELIERAAIAVELADAVIYLDLLAARLGIDLGRAVAHKFNRVSENRKAPQRLTPDPGTPCEPGVPEGW